jgi:DNA repair protein RadC
MHDNSNSQNNDVNETASHWPLTAVQVLEQAAKIIANKYLRGDTYSDPKTTMEYLTYKLSGYEREVFGIMFLDNQHRLIEYQELFKGTIDAASVYPREVVKATLKLNAAAVIITHNHPSGINEPSEADKQITTKLVEALKLIDVRVLDHIIIGETPLSFAERGLL